MTGAPWLIIWPATITGLTCWIWCAVEGVSVLVRRRRHLKIIRARQQGELL
jgi:hypothetical protein